MIYTSHQLHLPFFLITLPVRLHVEHDAVSDELANYRRKSRPEAQVAPENIKMGRLKKKNPKNKKGERLEKRVQPGRCLRLLSKLSKAIYYHFLTTL